MSLTTGDGKWEGETDTEGADDLTGLLSDAGAPIRGWDAALFDTGSVPSDDSGRRRPSAASGNRKFCD